MAVPKRRTTRSKSKMRRAQHDKVTAPNLSPCSQCGEPSLPHRVCGSCGYFKGKQIVTKSGSLTKPAARRTGGTLVGLPPVCVWRPRDLLDVGQVMRRHATTISVRATR